MKMYEFYSYFSSLELLHHILWASLCIFVKLQPLSSHRALIIRKLYCFDNIILTESFNIHFVTMATNYKHILCYVHFMQNLDKEYKETTERENVYTRIQNIMTLLIISSYKTRRLQFYISARTHLYIRVMWV